MKKHSPLYIIWLLALSIALACCTTEGERRQMARIIIEADSMNRHYVPMTSDSLLTLACRFYDRHGTPNERMKAHYLIGCAYRDMGEAPHAIDCYHQAAACADTMAQDCDYRTLGCIYSQMGDVYHRQLLLSYEIGARKQAQHFAELADDTLGAITSIKLIAGALILQDRKDTAEIVLQKALALYNKYGYRQDAVKASTMLMNIYADNPDQLSSLKTLINQYDSAFSLIDSCHILPPSKRQYYYYKGRYYENVGLLDSAEFYYRKIHRTNMSFQQKDPMYRGLLSIFQKRHQTDSIIKYTRLFCVANDSSIAIKDQAITAQLSASYNYSLYQRQAIGNAEKAKNRQTLISILIGIILVGLLVSFFFWHRHVVLLNKKSLALNLLKRELVSATRNYEEKRRLLQQENQEQLNRLVSEVEKVKREREEKERQLQQLRQSHESSIRAVKEELEKTREKNKESQNIIAHLNEQFEEEKTRLKHEIAFYNDKLEELNSHLDSDIRQKCHKFKDLGIIKRVNCFAKEGGKQLSDSDKNMLLDMANEFFPDVFNDLKGYPKIGRLALLVCVLVILNLKPNDIHNLLGISPSQVSNLRKAINFALFKDNTALTLQRNLFSHYRLY